MDTPLARQLQKAWLHTQMRKQQQQQRHTHSSSSSSSSSYFSPSSSGNSSLPPYLDSSVSSFTYEDSSCSTPPAFSSPPSASSQLPNDHSYHDPALQYINDMLLEEELEDCKCMEVECTSYQAMAKGFYDILGVSDEPQYSEPGSDTQEQESGLGPQEQPPEQGGEDYQGMNSFLNDDPALQQINDMLMEEDSENRKCMKVDCTAYQAMAKGFYDILGVSDEPQYSEPGLHTQQKESVLGPQKQPPEQDGQGCQGMNSFLNPKLASQSKEALAVAERRTASEPSRPRLSTVSSSYSSENASVSPGKTSESTAQLSNEGAPRLRNTFAFVSPALNIETPRSTDNSQKNKGHPGISVLTLLEHDDNHSQNEGPFQQEVETSRDRVLNFSTSHLSGRTKPFRRSVSDYMEVAARESGVSKLKRAASEKESGADSAPWDTEGGELLSFLNNKDVYAETLGDVPRGVLISSAISCGDTSSTTREGGKGANEKGMQQPETTVDLTALLMSCAEAVASDDLTQAHHILQQVRRDASPFGNGIQRLAYYFAEGLVARLSGTGALLYSAFAKNVPSAATMLRALHVFKEINPCAKLFNYCANRAILEAVEGAARLHVVDYGILYGLQWPSLISALAERKGGPPFLRLTGIDFPSTVLKSAERIEMTGRRLSECARTNGVPFEYRAIASKWETVQPSALHLKKEEVLVVNCILRLRHLPDETVLASNPRRTVLCRIRSMNPKVFVMGTRNGSYNSPFFKSRFREALSCFSPMYDLMDTTMQRDSQERLLMEREVMGRDIINVVSCEGLERVERPETYIQWENRTRRAGFEQMALNAEVRNEVRKIVKGSYHKEFEVDEAGKWMLLEWKGQVMYGFSLWKPSS